MHLDISTLAKLPDAELLTRISQLAHDERNLTAELVAHLMELDRRRLYREEGCSSLFTYCTRVLHLSEHAAYNRIVAARVSRKYPLVLLKLADSSIHLTTIRHLAPCLTLENHRQLIDEVTHKSKEQVAEIVARLNPQPPATNLIRKLTLRADLPGDGAQSTGCLSIPLSGQNRHEDAKERDSPAPPPGSTPTALPARSLRPGSSLPLAPDLYRLQLTTTAETHRKLLQAQELLRHRIPRSDPAKVIDLALTVLLLKLTRRKFALTTRPRAAGPRAAAGQAPTGRPRAAAGQAPTGGPRPTAGQAPTGGPRSDGQPRASFPRAPRSRHIPAAVRREVWRRDRGRCVFSSRNGRRCGERGPLEFHHRTPHALGGPATAENIELRCRCHNVYESELVFGATGRDRPGDS